MRWWTMRWWVTDCREHSLKIFLCSFTVSLPGFCLFFFHSSLLWDKCFFCKRIHPFVLFFLSLCSRQSLINVTLQLCNPSQTFFIKTLPTLLSTDDFPRVSIEPLGIFFLDATLKLRRFLLQILKFFHLVINCLAVFFWIPLWNCCLQWHSWQLAVKIILASAFRVEFFTKSRVFLDHFHSQKRVGHLH